MFIVGGGGVVEGGGGAGIPDEVMMASGGQVESLSLKVTSARWIQLEVE